MVCGFPYFIKFKSEFFNNDNVLLFALRCVGSKEIPQVIGKFGLGVQNEAGQRLTELFQENTQIVENILFQLLKRQLYTWTSPDGQYQNQMDYILCR